jgi:hypothetical protein
MKKLLLLSLVLLHALFVTAQLDVTYSDSQSGTDAGPTVATVTFDVLPGTTITDIEITASIGGKCPSWYVYHLDLDGTLYEDLCNMTAASYSDLNGEEVNGQTITITSEDTDNYTDNITLSLSVKVYYSPPAGAPGAPANPSPANNATDVALNGNLTWDFGADTETYDLMFGPAGAMVKVVDDAVAGVGTYAYADINSGASYQWQVIAKNASKATTNGPVWGFTVECDPSIPYFEGFEANHTNNTALSNCWSQEAVAGTNAWTANSSETNYNRTPRTGSWNAFLRYGNTRWMFQRISVVEATSYTVEVYARQDGATAANASIAVSYGATPDATAMTNEIVAQTGIINGNYQLLTGTFTPASSGDIYLGILGTINDTPWYISIDDISVFETPSCLPPSSLVSSNITTNTADLGWTENGTATTWNIKYGAPGFDVETEGTSVAGVTDNPYTLGGLTANTTYDWYVQADCGGGDLSPWAGPSTFTTACEAVADFSEDFDGVTAPAIPNCWQTIVEHPTSTFAHVQTTTGTTPHSAPNHVSMYNTFTASADIELLLISPQVDSDLTERRLRFHAKRGGSAESVQVGTITDPTDAATFTPLTTIELTTTYTEYIYNLDGYAGADEYIAFRHANSGTGRYVYLDNINLEEIPTATLSWYNLQWPGTAEIPKNENVTIYAQAWESGVTEPDGPGAGIEAWIGYSDTDATELADFATGWTWIAAEYNFDADDPGFNNDEYKAELGAAQGLAPGTYYYASRFRYLSGPFTYGGFQDGPWNGTNNVSGELTITECNAASIPYFERFDDVVAPAIPPCMEVENVNEDANEWLTTATSVLSAPNAAYINYNSTIATDDWLYTQGLTLEAGKTYEVGFAYRARSTSYTENLAVWWGDSPEAASMTDGPIFVEEGFNNILYILGTGIISPDETGVYFVGFHGYSAPDKWGIYLDDIYVIEQVANTTWTGAVNNDWHNAGNWVDGALPGSSTDVVIPAGLTNYPTLSFTATINNILIGSSAAGTASLLDNNNLTVNGQATIQRYINGGGYHNVSVPLDGGATAAAFLHSYLRKFDAETQAWVNITEPTDALEEDEGYMIWYTGANTTYEFTGDLITGAFSASTHSGASEPGEDGEVYNLVPNPYPSAIDWDAGSGWTKTNLQQALYIWNREAGGGANGQYASFVIGSGGTHGATQYIPVGQSFFVEATSGGAPVLAMNNNVRVHSDQAFLKDNEVVPDLLRIQVQTTEGKDESIIHLRQSATAAFDGQFDARKLYGSLALPQLYSLSSDNQMLSINALAVNDETTIVPLAVEWSQSGEITLSFSNLEGFENSTTIFLEDLLTEEMMDIHEHPAYTFNYTEGDEPMRFRIHFKGVTSVDDLAAANHHIWSHYDRIYITMPESFGNMVRIELFDLLGNRVMDMRRSLDNPTIIRSTAKGVVIVRVTEADRVYTQKLFIR